jgi:ribonuclease T1
VSWLAVAVVAFALSTEVPIEKLPPEARETIALIKAGGPFPYSQDGKTFQNREKILPRKERGYYREYTVKTPGAKDRGARRIVGGRCGEYGCLEYYYTDDHYRSFRRIIE